MNGLFVEGLQITTLGLGVVFAGLSLIVVLFTIYQPGSRQKRQACEGIFMPLMVLLGKPATTR